MPVAPLYERIDRVETVEIGKAYRGIIVQTRGLSRREGYFAARLRLLNDGKPGEDGMIELEFLARPPSAATPPPGPDAVATFPLTAAQYLRAEQLDGAKGLRVVARDNALTQAF
ncbi:MAG: hypothetical protein D6754_07110 [Alphaproteobacteria bacterium]|nr:MAG: hypothetical protein D6754_07110 [Alphaproteobacteria bacterium]